MGMGIAIRLMMGMGMGMVLWEWEGMGTEIVLPAHDSLIFTCRLTPLLTSGKKS